MALVLTISACVILLVALSLILPLVRINNSWWRIGTKVLLTLFVIILCFSSIQVFFNAEPAKPVPSPTVYVNFVGFHYHSESCLFLISTLHPIPLFNAVINDYHRCSSCNPPKFNSSQYASITRSIEINAPSITDFLISFEYILPGIAIAIFIIILWRTKVFSRLEDSGHHYAYQFIVNLCTSLGLFFLPATIIVFAAVYSIGGAAILPLGFLQKLLRPLINLFRKPAKPQVIKISAPDYIADDYTAEHPSSNVLSALTAQTTEYALCEYMWTNSIIFCNEFIPKATLKQNTYLWTAFFYTVTKTIQDQVIVDKIYSQFRVATLPFITDKDNTNKYLSVVQAAYWDFRKLLNASRIDPRTDSGSHALWIFLCSQLCPELTLSSDAENKFIKCTNLILDRAVSAYQPKPTPEPTPKPTSEPVYLMEAANGMLVNVPESRLEAWEAEQDKLRKGENLELTKAERESINRILDAIYGPKDSGTE